MSPPVIPADERDRLRALRRLGLLDGAPDERFDRIARIALRVFDVPIAMVNLVDADRVAPKSALGVSSQDTDRAVSFCSHAINEPEALVVEDAREDSRFSDNPAVTGGPEIRFYAGRPISSPDGSPIGTLCIAGSDPRAFPAGDLESLNDLAEMVERELANIRLAIDDELTGLCNRRGFHLLANQALALCRRRGASAALVYADVDGLKTANDRFGHGRGDELLRSAAQVLDASFRDADVVARVGGDEFAAFLSDFAGDTADLVERIGRAVAARNDAHAPLGSPLSIAVGAVVVGPERSEPLEVVLAEADAQMYAAKLSGRAPRPA